MKLKWAEERIILSVGIQAPLEQNMDVCVCVCVCIEKESERERARKWHLQIKLVKELDTNRYFLFFYLHFIIEYCLWC